ncbi:hypothetical protein IEQ34_014886 [Dendrobium chrysotoxum]|uniref:Uncharacterized protein n=1 Tax=Dendrobium chrysotoxum TaxID=161865 RepID=A0AAV7GNF5_DENCH|nr:hypothetical protein IEQ34_014886 [Dendrobium chrysotoxum]
MLNIPDIENFFYKVCYLGIYLKEEYLFKLGGGIFFKMILINSSEFDWYPPRILNLSKIILDDIHIILDNQVKIETLIRATKLMCLIKQVILDDSYIVRDDRLKSEILSCQIKLGKF